MVTLLAMLLSMQLAATAAHAVGAPSSAEKEALGFAISTWSGTCSGGTRSAWDDMVRAWYDALIDSRAWPLGHSSEAWNGDGVYTNSPIADPWFCDPTEVSWGEDNDNDRLDDVDVVMVALHGSHSGSTGPWLGSVHTDEPGDPSCYASQADIRVGDYDLEFLHISSCHSMCDADEGFSNWYTSAAGVHAVSGFYGIMWIGSSFISDYRKFANDGFSQSLTDAWLDRLYEKNVSGGHDQCPVMMVPGISENTCSLRATNEEYDYVYDTDYTSPTKFLFISIKDCDPMGHNP